MIETLVKEKASHVTTVEQTIQTHKTKLKNWAFVSNKNGMLLFKVTKWRRFLSVFGLGLEAKRRRQSNKTKNAKNYNDIHISPLKNIH